MTFWEPCWNTERTIGALYTTLDRLETKGLVETWMEVASVEANNSGTESARPGAA